MTAVYNALSVYRVQTTLRITACTFTDHVAVSLNTPHNKMLVASVLATFFFRLAKTITNLQITIQQAGVLYTLCTFPLD